MLTALLQRHDQRRQRAVLTATAQDLESRLSGLCSAKPLYEEGADGGYNVWRRPTVRLASDGTIHVTSLVEQEFMPHGGGGPRHRRVRDDWSYALLLEFRDLLNRAGYQPEPVIVDGWRTTGWLVRP